MTYTKAQADAIIERDKELSKTITAAGGYSGHHYSPNIPLRTTEVEIHGVTFRGIAENVHDLFAHSQPDWLDKLTATLHLFNPDVNLQSKIADACKFYSLRRITPESKENIMDYCYNLAFDNAANKYEAATMIPHIFGGYNSVNTPGGFKPTIGAMGRARGIVRYALSLTKHKSAYDLSLEDEVDRILLKCGVDKKHIKDIHTAQTVARNGVLGQQVRDAVAVVNGMVQWCYANDMTVFDVKQLQDEFYGAHQTQYSGTPRWTPTSCAMRAAIHVRSVCADLRQADKSDADCAELVDDIIIRYGKKLQARNK